MKRAFEKLGVEYVEGCEIVDLKLVEKRKTSDKNTKTITKPKQAGTLKHKKPPVIFEFPVFYHEDEVMSDHVLRSICHVIKVDFEKLMFEL